MTRIRDAAMGVFEFIAGDDWRSAAGVALALVLTALMDGSAAAWVVTPLVVAALLASSIRRAFRGAREQR